MVHVTKGRVQAKFRAGRKCPSTGAQDGTGRDRKDPRTEKQTEKQNTWKTQ